MNETFLDRYQISSARAAWWDYSNAGAYFITICTDARKHFFGRIENNSMLLSPCGTLAEVFWRRIPDHSKFAVLGRYVVMPNHIHGILHVADGRVPRPRSVDNVMSGISPQANSVSVIVRSYKSAVTRQAQHLGFDFAWQPRFYDRIIRDEDEYSRIEQYIVDNVSTWGRNDHGDNEFSIVGHDSPHTDHFP
jgi:putative transposase